MEEFGTSEKGQEKLCPLVDWVVLGSILERELLLAAVRCVDDDVCSIILA